ncbi:MAG: VanZ family protein [Thiohalocapsa sp.]|uniref:VanZ family protein n=1 Tax=Thiohalocapsa sp. TaxID=2497641 RepID=UPI0025F64B98|nr:VanZ family protein [Thiohalocapsa sp.]MCG6943576.1 VanZ family protein [Thiohalocapsa sp.]
MSAVHAGLTKYRLSIVRLVQRAARLGLLACVLAIAYLAFAPLPDPTGFGWDKANHLMAFAVLAVLSELGWPGPAARPWRLALVLGYGVLIELVQAQLAYRQGSVLDFAADALGVALYLAGKRAALWLWARLGGPGLSGGGAGVGRSAPADSRRSPGG